MSQDPTASAAPPSDAPAIAPAESSSVRRHARRALESPLSIEVDTHALEGMADNLSRVGLMLYTDQPLRVTVRIDGFRDGQPLQGRLVRLQRMDEDTTGLAIEFDELLEPEPFE